MGSQPPLTTPSHPEIPPPLRPINRNPSPLLRQQHRPPSPPRLPLPQRPPHPHQPHLPALAQHRPPNLHLLLRRNPRGLPLPVIPLLPRPRLDQPLPRPAGRRTPAIGQITLPLRHAVAEIWQDEVVATVPVCVFQGVRFAAVYAGERVGAVLERWELAGGLGEGRGDFVDYEEQY